LIRTVALAALLAAGAHGQDSAAVFDDRCASCHAREAEAPPMAGPNLHGLRGRRAGGDPAYDYSPALAQAGFAWDAARLDRYLADPEEALPGTWMNNAVRNAAERAALVRWLLSD
jgi:cytochrome c